MSLAKRGFLVYSNYVGLKTHFNTEKFFFNLNSKPNITGNSYINRIDKVWFERLAKDYSIKQTKQLQEYLISSFLYNKKIWIGDIVENDSLQLFHNNRLKTRTALNRTFEQDIFNIEEYLIDNNINLKSILTSSCGRPVLLYQARKLKISLETLAMFSYVFKFTKNKSDDIIYEEERLKLEKYSYLIKSDFDVKKIKSMIDSLISIETKNDM